MEKAFTLMSPVFTKFKSITRLIFFYTYFTSYMAQEKQQGSLEVFPPQKEKGKEKGKRGKGKNFFT